MTGPYSVALRTQIFCEILLRLLVGVNILLWVVFLEQPPSETVCVVSIHFGACSAPISALDERSFAIAIALKLLAFPFAYLAVLMSAGSALRNMFRCSANIEARFPIYVIGIRLSEPIVIQNIEIQNKCVNMGLAAWSTSLAGSAMLVK
jgi:hypothetical protein